jgi:hypothetical protein
MSLSALTTRDSFIFGLIVGAYVHKILNIISKFYSAQTCIHDIVRLQNWKLTYCPIIKFIQAIKVSTTLSMHWMKLMELSLDA